MRKPIDPVQRLARELADLKAKLEEYITAPRLQNSSISKGALRILSPEGLIVVGSASVSGLLDVDGTLDGTGSFDWSGPWELSGAGQITGDVTATGTWTWQGDLNLSGDFDMSGSMFVTGDITILPGGKMIIGNMIIDPADGGSVQFPGGAVVRGQGGNGVEMVAGAYVASVRQGYARLGTSSSNFEVDGFTGMRINGVVSASGLGTPINTLHVLSDGSLRKSTGL